MRRTFLVPDSYFVKPQTFGESQTPWICAEVVAALLVEVALERDDLVAPPTKRVALSRNRNSLAGVSGYPCLECSECRAAAVLVV